jgi:hypothetical protein
MANPRSGEEEGQYDGKIQRSLSETMLKEWNVGKIQRWLKEALTFVKSNVF